VADTAMKRAMKGDFDLFGEAAKIYGNIEKADDGRQAGEDYFQEKGRYLRNFKKIALLTIHGAFEQFKKSLVNEQEVLNNIAEIIMDIYTSESLKLRVEKLESMKGSGPVYRDILDVNVYDTAAKIRKSATDAVCSFASPDIVSKLSGGVEALTRVAAVNVKDARRRIADKLIEDNLYKF